MSRSAGNQLRRDPLLGYQVVIAEGREDRPQQWKASIPPPSAMRCPFCGGHEDATPHERLVLPANAARSADQMPWEVRVLPNIYPSLSPDFPDEVPASDDNLYTFSSASGVQEVIVESPQHITSFAQLPEANAVLTFQAYQQRLNAMRAAGHCRYVQLFKNNGPAAGASLEHSHSQLMATRIVPPIVQHELDASEAYFQTHQRSFWSDLIERELAAGSRIVHADENLIAFCPFASRMPFELCVLPRLRQADFGGANPTLLEQLALLLRSLLARVEKALNFPAYNYLIHTLPFDTFAQDHYHWHVEVLPRVTVRAGFEWGTGLYVNPLSPERAAQILRDSA
ncbi:galactose-1-phosphate uridylyltransferase [Blastopirellula marina]|uniref:Galactose-1-phosphate uridylyltransferase n=1 Tax=Blastopirellula marina TaxID=124 RepID=A0A2S8F4T1_9BACT|nr:galactose-1-phosphate uridylyltransferase [Blastopirellula marina]PQO27172.1 galactose-1-phosphate uridylyltransferase [Blastopirellula marina]PTL41319.1 galactose-1-phosphate uridylyltransferase [Blastopirellula marina]